MQFQFNYENSNIKYLILRAYSLYANLMKLKNYTNLRTIFLNKPQIYYDFDDKEQKHVFSEYQDVMLSTIIFLFFDEYYFSLFKMIQNFEAKEFENIPKLFFQEFFKNKEYNLKEVIPLQKIYNLENEFAYKFVYEETNDYIIPELTQKSFNVDAVLISSSIEKFSFPFLTIDEIKKQVLEKSKDRSSVMNRFSCYLYYLVYDNIIYFETAFVVSGKNFYISDKSYLGISFLFKDYHYLRKEDNQLFLSTIFPDYSSIINSSSYIESLININKSSVSVSDFTSSYVVNL